MTKISKTILFYWSKGAETRRNIVRFIYQRQEKNEPCFLNLLAKEFNLSHVAIKKHLDLLIEENFVEAINPSGKPVYLKLTPSGKKVIKELSER